MSVKKCFIFLSIIIILLAGMTLLVSAAPTVDPVKQWVIGAGGAEITAGVHVLNYTLGQPIAIEVETGSNALCAGYWCDPAYSVVYLPMVVRVP